MEKVKGAGGKYRILVGVACFFLIFICGCGLFEEYNCTTIKLQGNGKIKEYIVEPFDSSIYNFDELVAQTQNEIAVYNQEKGSDAVEVESSELVDGNVKLVINYPDDNSYYNINGKVLFYGTCRKASDAGYNPVGQVKSVQNGDTLDTVTWNNMSDTMKIAIIYEDVDVVTPGKILYISDGVTLKDEKKAVTDGEGIRYIIF